MPRCHRRPVLVQMFPCATDCQLQQLRHCPCSHPLFLLDTTREPSDPASTYIQAVRTVHVVRNSELSRRRLVAYRMTFCFFGFECFLHLMILDSPYSTSNCCQQLHSSSSYRFDIVCASSTCLELDSTTRAFVAGRRVKALHGNPAQLPRQE